ncbi:putative permease [Vibrio thalassae]|uniref:Putative permease n=1 Tax=Vibrio thalassae TaxID=1243014 RepID=A0A240EGD1_9VIBR|nr:permease [Vibrio thalassae]SNX47616.1 putative permease [Vibrio thalassae]
MNPEFLEMAKETANMFAFLTTELIILFLAISYIVGVLQEFLTPEKIQSILTSKNGKGYFVAALLGSITPFCSCSTIPFLKGLLRARAGFGPMMVFLFASPLLNPVIIGLFVVTFGIQVAVFYFSIAMFVAVVAGYVLEKLGFERYVKPEAYQTSSAASSCGTSCGDSKPAKVETSACATSSSSCGTSAAPVTTPKKEASCCAPVAAKTSCCSNEEPAITDINTDGSACCGTTSAVTKEDSRWLRIWKSTWSDFKQVFPYLMIGILLGSFIYGFIPTNLIAEYAGEGVWYAIPIAAVIGIPLYIRAEAVIPLSAALVQKGMALGSVMALIIGSAGASLTEVILLKSIFKNQMIAAFLAVILGMAISAGYLYSYLFG